MSIQKWELSSGSHGSTRKARQNDIAGVFFRFPETSWRFYDFDYNPHLNINEFEFDTNSYTHIFWQFLSKWENGKRVTRVSFELATLAI